MMKLTICQCVSISQFCCISAEQNLHNVTKLLLLLLLKKRSEAGFELLLCLSSCFRLTSTETHAEGREGPHAAGHQPEAEPRQQPHPWGALPFSHLPSPLLHQDLPAPLASTPPQRGPRIPHQRGRRRRRRKLERVWILRFRLGGERGCSQCYWLTDLSSHVVFIELLLPFSLFVYDFTLKFSTSVMFT